MWKSSRFALGYLMVSFLYCSVATNFWSYMSDGLGYCTETALCRHLLHLQRHLSCVLLSSTLVVFYFWQHLSSNLTVDRKALLNVHHWSYSWQSLHCLLLSVSSLRLYSELSGRWSSPTQMNASLGRIWHCVNSYVAINYLSDHGFLYW